MSRLVFSVCILGIILISQASGQGLMRIGDSEAVSFRLDQLRTIVMNGHSASIEDIMATDFRIGCANHAKSDATVLFDSAFASNSKRTTAFSQPATIQFDGFWDFDIQNVNITIDGDSAYVDCRLILHAQETNDRSEYAAIDHLLFVKSEFGWKLSGCNNLFDFLIESGVNNEEE